MSKEIWRQRQAIGNTLFADNQQAGYTHSIKWHTPGIINLTGFNLFAVYDYDSDSYARSFQEFRLYYYNGWNWIKFYTLDSIPPYGFGSYQQPVPEPGTLMLLGTGLLGLLGLRRKRS